MVAEARWNMLGVSIIRNRVLEQLLVCVLPCCCWWCRNEPFIEFTSTRIVSYTFRMAANLLQLLSEVGYFGGALTKTYIMHREKQLARDL